MNRIFDKTRVNDLNFSLNVLSQKNTQITRNIAHADTPMYRAKKLEFDEVMAEYFSQSTPKKLYVTHEKHLTPAGSETDPAYFVRRQNNPSTRTDGNDVNLDYEMSEQAGTSILYTMLTEIVGGKFGGLKDVITSR
jgi:flagellar basal-body rod protein FlgB